MNLEIMKAVIAAAASVITCVLGLTVGKSNGGRKESSKDLAQEQLNKIFMPLDIVLTSNSTPENKLIEVGKIVSNEYVLVPPELLKEWNTLSCKKTITDADLAFLKKWIGTRFEWARKVLGYPYDKKRIDKKLTPVYLRNSEIIATLEMVYIFSWAMSLFVVFVTITGAATEKIPSWLLLLCFTNAFAGAFPYIIMVSNNRKKNEASRKRKTQKDQPKE